MKNFPLDKDSQYILRIISQLKAEPTHELTLSDLETKLGIAKQTVKSYFNKLLDYCHDQSLTTFSVNANHFRMKTGTPFNHFKLHHYLVQKSAKYQIMTSVFTDTATTFTSLQRALGISRSKLSVHLKEINDFLADYNCHINFLQKNPMLGEEHQIRFIYHNLFWGLDLDEIIDNTPSLEAASQLLLEFVPNLDYSTFIRIKLSFYIFQVHARHGFFLSEEEFFTIPDSPYVTYDDFFEKIEATGFLDKCPDLATKERECRYLYFIFCRANLIMLETWQTTNLQINHAHYTGVHDLITQFQDTINFQLATSELNYLHYNLTLMNQEAKLFKGRNKVYDLEQQAEEAYRTEAKTLTFINTFIQNLCEHNPELQTLIQNFPNLHIHYIMLFKNVIMKHKQPLKVFVQSNSSPIHREMLMSKIRNSTPVPIVFYDFNQLKDEKPDAIISNWMPEQAYADVPFFSTSRFYSSWNKTELDDFLTNLSDQKNNFVRITD